MSVAGAYSRHHDTSASNYQVWSWFFMRVSGLVLVFLVLGHMLIMHVLDGGVDRINYDFVAQRWTGYFWRTYDWLMLALAMLHGAIGAHNSIVDHIRKPRRQKVAKAILYGVVLVLLVLGTFVIVSFEPFQTAG